MYKPDRLCYNKAVRKTYLSGAGAYVRLPEEESKGEGYMRRFMCGILCGGLLLCSGCVGGAPAESTAPPVSSPGTVTAGTTTTAATTTATTTTTVTVPTPAPGVSGPLSSEQVARLDSKLSSYGGKVSVGFLDLTSGV